MRLTMNCCRCFLAGGVAQAEDLPCAFIEPIFDVIHAMLLLNLKILGVGTRKQLPQSSRARACGYPCRVAC